MSDKLDVRVVRKHDKGCEADRLRLVGNVELTDGRGAGAGPYARLHCRCKAEVLVSERAVVELAEKVMNGE